MSMLDASIAYPADKGPVAGLRGRPSHIALIGNYLPRLCGLATYTTHVRQALRARFPDTEVDVYAMVDLGHSYAFPEAVVRTIDQDDRASYQAAARAIVASGADLIWVQHEFGIFGGPAGAYLLELIDAVTTPVAVTFHTILETPSTEQQDVIDRLAARASLLIVMADRARAILERAYGVPPGKIAVVPHGVPDRDYIDPPVARRALGLEDRPSIMTFGLLSPGKGIETMIRAMPAILEQCPDALYWIVGATHPHLVSREGEAYRESLRHLARSLGVDRWLRWHDGFLEERDLLDRIAAADVYVTPYRNPAQITSGTLAYAMGLGKPIVSTPYAHASELLADGYGSLVPFDDPPAMADALLEILTQDAARRAMAARSYLRGRDMTWRRMVERSIMRMSAALRPPATIPAGAVMPLGCRAAAERPPNGVLNHAALFFPCPE
ncbi:MAG: glycosyltransferase family 4 protein [Sphingomonas sp.]|jgi:glycosyltransferase involved in cell wall biosynthesis|uniref:glycosyltransferase family 4 protein n=1 Tax=Sphingomonas sp. TaxID=28214 RepID=UPI0035634BD8